MVEVKKSKCCCGKCKIEFWVEWDLEIETITEQSMGECIYYSSSIKYECPNCGNKISGELYVSEYPVGTLEFAEVREIVDSEGTNSSKIETPVIAFFDL
ncbi:MAG: hypothetical protein ACI4DX_04905 [Oliverpabstia sp.]